MSNDLETDIIGALYSLYEQSLYFEAYKILHDTYLSEDAVQETFLRLIRHRDKIRDPSSPQVRGYVYKTLKSAALDIYRRQKIRRENCCTLDERIDIAAENAPLFASSASLIAELPPKYAGVIRCLFVSGLTVRETAAVLKISEACVRKRCERARKYLKKLRYTDRAEKEIRHER